MAEIEHFVHPIKKEHIRFKNVANVPIALLSKDIQDGDQEAPVITIGQAVAQGIVNNQTLGYFMARTQLFLLKCGLPAQKVRFRQHKSAEMAHYASDCWDAEALRFSSPSPHNTCADLYDLRLDRVCGAR